MIEARRGKRRGETVMCAAGVVEERWNIIPEQQRGLEVQQQHEKNVRKRMSRRV